MATECRLPEFLAYTVNFVCLLPVFVYGFDWDFQESGSSMFIQLVFCVVKLPS